MKLEDQPPSQPHQHQHHIKKKRVGKACDSCRIKKTKCDGKKPCNKCISDNKICVFTEKKKPKEKNHPPGYVELLETRLDILTKLFEKLVELSQPHLPFIDEIIQNNNKSIKYESSSSSSLISEENELNEDDDLIPINKIVSYLIEQKGLLKNLPMDWDQGALIAANYNYKQNFDTSVQLFAQHKYDNENDKELNSPLVSPELKPKKVRSKKTKVKQELNSPSYSHNNQPQHQFSLDNVQNLEPVSSDIDSDSPTTKISPPPDYFHKRAGSLFNQDIPNLTKINSVSSLTNKYEDHNLSSPTGSIFSHAPVINTLRRSSSSTSNSNKIQKPQHHHHNRNLSIDSKKKLDNNSTTSINNILMDQQSIPFFNYQQDDMYDDFNDSSKSFFNNTNNNTILQSQPLLDNILPYQPNYDILVNDPNLDHLVSNNNPFMGTFR